MTTKKQKITAVLALAIAFGLGMAVMCGCSYFTQEKVAEIHKTVGTILDIAYTSGGAVLVEQKIDQLVADGCAKSPKRVFTQGEPSFGVDFAPDHMPRSFSLLAIFVIESDSIVLTAPVSPTSS